MKAGVLVFSYANFVGFQHLLKKQGFYSINLGDYMQTLAVRQALRQIGILDSEIIPVDRDTVTSYSGEDVALIMNGCFFEWNFPLPEQIKPIFIGFQMSGSAIARHAAHLKRFEPIGCRDDATWHALTSHGIEATVTGCLTLTFPPRVIEPGKQLTVVAYGERAGALPSSLLLHMPDEQRSNLELVFQRRTVSCFPLTAQEMSASEAIAAQILERYRADATLVVTPLHHAATPAIASGVPVVLARDTVDDRFSYLERLMTVYRHEQFASIDWKGSLPDLQPARRSLIRLLRESLEALDPDGWGFGARKMDLPALRARGEALLAGGNPAAAITLVESATQSPNDADLGLIRARALLATKRRSEAVRALEAILEIDPDHPARYHLVSALSYHPDDAEKAITHARRWLSQKPTSATVHHSLGVALLRLKRFEEGWDEALWRQKIPAPYVSLRPGEQPYWNGGELDGKLLYFPEVGWGIGLDLLAASLLPEFEARGIEVVMEAPKKLVGPLQRSFPKVEFVAYANPPDVRFSASDIRARAYFGHAARAFRGSFGAFGEQRAFLGPATRAVREPGARPRVGLAWHTTNPTHGSMRSVRLTDWHALLGCPGIDFVALQYGDVLAELAEVERTLGTVVERPSADYFHDIEALLTAIDSVDLVLTIDNSTVHFAGAMGKPCWLMLSPEPYFLWGRDETTSEWYPSVRFLRSREYDWKNALATAARDVEIWANERMSAAQSVN